MDIDAPSSTPAPAAFVEPGRRRGFTHGFAAGALGGLASLLLGIGVLVATGVLRSGRSVVTTVIRQVAIADSTLDRGRYTSPQAVYLRDAAGVVTISAAGASVEQSSTEYLRGEDGGEGSASGSGFEVDSYGDIVTNWHVVKSATRVTVSIGEPAHAVPARIVAEDPARDVAVLRITTAGLTLHPLVAGDSRHVQVGETVLAIGNPFDYGRTLTGGIVSAIERRIQAPNGATIADAIQTDAPINPGSSGGPLLNSRGDVIGINSEIVASGNSGANVGIAFAIPIDVAKSELSEVEKRIGP